MLLRRVSLDKKRLQVSISGKVFNVWGSEDEGYVLKGGPNLLEHVRGIRLSDLPEHLAVEIGPRLSEKFGLQRRLNFSASRKAFKVSYLVTASRETLIDVEEYASEIARKAEEHGFSCQTSKTEEEIHIEASYREGGGEEIGYIVKLFEDALASADRSIEQKEENMRQKLEYWIGKVGRLDGRFLSKLNGLEGVAKWIIHPLTSKEIAYILFGIKPESFNLGAKLSYALLQRFEVWDGETIDRLKALGIIAYMEDNSRLFCTFTGWRVKKLLEQMIFLEPKSFTSSTAGGYDPISLLHYIGRNFPSLAISKSRRFRGNKSGAFRYAEKMLKQLTFTHIAALAGIYWRLHIPKQVLEETLSQLISLGFISHNRKIKPFAKWIISLINGYIRKTKLAPNQKQAQTTLFNWNCLQETFIKQISKKQ